MMDEKKCSRQISLLWMSGVCFLLFSMILLVASLIMPLGVDLDPAGQDRNFGKISLSALDRNNLSLLESKAMVRLIIKAAQSQAAVKDNGLAAELAKSLRLQGIANMPNGLTAYIRDTKEKRTLSIHEGEKVGDFIVRKVDLQSVTLDLDGVEIRLSY